MRGAECYPALRAPLYVVWEVTLSCNARCIHCYSNASFGRGPQIWPTEDCLALIDELADAGVIVLGFSGGEFLLRRDWETLVRRASARGIRVTLGTNGLLVTRDVARRLKDSGVWNVSVSLDGATAAVHERVRGVAGIFDAACSAVRTLTAEGVRTTVNFTPMRVNFREAESVVHLAHRLGANKVNLTEYVYLSRGGLDLMLAADELRDIVELWRSMGDLYRGRMEVDWHDCRVALMLPKEEAPKYRGCGAGYSHCRITADRSVTPCVVLPFVVGNLRQTSFGEIWRDSPALAQIRSRESIVTGNCSGCEHKAVCGGCRATSQAFYGHPFGGDPLCWVRREEPCSPA